MDFVNEIDMCNSYSYIFPICYMGKENKIALNISELSEANNLLKLKSILNMEEIEYFDTLRYKSRMESYLLGRFSAKKAISVFYEKLKLSDIKIEIGVFNQPIIVNDMCKNMQVSISHSGNSAASIAFPDDIIMGIDMEKIECRAEEMVESELTDYEREMALISPYSYRSILTIIWTIKEAISKALKTGLTLPLYLLEIKQIQYKNKYIFSTYKNFPQYTAISYILNGYAYSIAFPKNIDICFVKNKENE